MRHNFPLTTEEGLHVSCSDCGARLELHQPDERHPTSLLGTCVGCELWHLIQLGSDLGTVAEVLALDRRVLRALCGRG